MAEKVNNYEVIKSYVFTTKKVVEKNKPVIVPDKWKNELIGIYPSHDEAEFILAKAKKNESYESNKKYIPHTTFSIRKTDNPVTSGIVGKYLSSDLYLSNNQKQKEANNG